MYTPTRQCVSASCIFILDLCFALIVITENVRCFLHRFSLLKKVIRCTDFASSKWRTELVDSSPNKRHSLHPLRKKRNHEGNFLRFSINLPCYFLWLLKSLPSPKNADFANRLHGKPGKHKLSGEGKQVIT